MSILTFDNALTALSLLFVLWAMVCLTTARSVGAQERLVEAVRAIALMLVAFLIKSFH